MIEEKITKLRNVDALSPQEIAQESIELSSLWASVNMEIVDRKMAYNLKLKNLLEVHQTAPKAKIHAESSNEFRELLEVEAYSKSVQELIRSCKVSVKLAESELREAKY